MQITPISALTLLFVTLKLTGFIAWSWWWVLSPLWIGLIVVTVAVTAGLLYCYWKPECKSKITFSIGKGKK